MLVPHLIENIFRSGLTLATSNDFIIIKIDSKNLNKINKQKRLLKKWALKWTRGKRTQIMRWKKDNLQIFTLTNVLFLEIFSVTKIKNKLFGCVCIE